MSVSYVPRSLQSWVSTTHRSYSQLTSFTFIKFGRVAEDEFTMDFQVIKKNDPPSFFFQRQSSPESRFRTICPMASMVVIHENIFFRRYNRIRDPKDISNRWWPREKNRFITKFRYYRTIHQEEQNREWQKSVKIGQKQSFTARWWIFHGISLCLKKKASTYGLDKAFGIMFLNFVLLVITSKLKPNDLQNPPFRLFLHHFLTKLKTKKNAGAKYQELSKAVVRI